MFPIPFVAPEGPVPLDTFVRSMCMHTNAGLYSFAMVYWAPNGDPHASVLAVLFQPDRQVLHWRVSDPNQPFDKEDKQDSLLTEEYNTSFEESCTWLHHQVTLTLTRYCEYHPQFIHLSVQRTRCEWYKTGATQSALKNSLWRVRKLYGGLCVLIVLALLTAVADTPPMCSAMDMHECFCIFLRGVSETCTARCSQRFCWNLVTNTALTCVSFPNPLVSPIIWLDGFQAVLSPDDAEPPKDDDFTRLIMAVNAGPMVQKGIADEEAVLVHVLWALDTEWRDD